MASSPKLDRSPKSSRRRRVALWSLVALLAVTLAAPLSGYVYVATVSAQTSSEMESNPRANYWRAVRGGDEGYSAVDSPEAGVLVHNGGQIWRELRNGPVATYGAYFLAAVLFALVAFHIIFGRAKLDAPRTGKMVYRWSGLERAVHWFVAITFILLAITGISLLWGRAVMMPVLGREGFAAFAALSKDVHNYIGPFFIAGLALMLIMWFKENFFARYDLEWLKSGGGYFSKGSHPPAGKANAGEKVWFWMLFFGGIVVSVTGVILDFPNLGADRSAMQLSWLLHAVSSVVLMGLALGHIYLGSVGNEGSTEGMVSGYVDETWAKQHHSEWFKEQQEKAGQTTLDQPTSAGGDVGQTRPA